MSKKNNEPKNGDFPFDAFKVAVDDDGSCGALFYVAAQWRKGSKEGYFLSLDDLQESQTNSRKEGLNSPLTDEAIRLLRRAMDLPELH